MDRLAKFEKTYADVVKALQDPDLFRDEGLSGPVTLVDTRGSDLSHLAGGSGKIGWPATAWWWFAEDFFRPIGRGDIKSLLPKEDEMDPKQDPVFRMPVVGAIEGRRTLTEFWESLGYETLRKERRSGRLAEKKAFTAGYDVPSAPSTEWLGLPKDYLSGKANAMEICKDPSLAAKLDSVLHELTGQASPPAGQGEENTSRFQHMHPMTEMLIEKTDDFTEHCLSIGPDDEVAAEILKLQEMLLRQMVVNRSTSRRLCKSALRSVKFERKQAIRRERLEKEIRTCQRTIEAHEKKKKEKEQETEAAKSDEEVKNETPDKKVDVPSNVTGVSQSSAATKSHPSIPKKEEPTVNRYAVIPCHLPLNRTSVNCQ